ncbi:CotH kinase family protein [Paenibacillus sp. y28]|uniref:CotH kinase family protein n=1 Tax=Paenibacillus sp. y28 TaxID=3129110 RepID=UPI00301A3D99
MKWTHVLKKFTVALVSAAVVTSVSGLAGTAAPALAADSGIAQPYESLFEGDRIMDVKVTIADEDWQSILASPLDKEYKQATVEVDGNVLENVGFSTKGNLTLKAVAGMSDSDRYSFRLKFDKYDKSQTLLGLDKMVLNNSYSDPSFLREYLHYEALRKIGMDVPLTVFTNLYINGELYGFYVGVEAVDDSYLKRNYGEGYEEGVLYDTDEKSYLQYEAGSEYESITYDGGTEDNKASLKHFIQTLNEMPAGEKGDIESVLNVDSALQYIAANAVLGNYDSYNGDKGHNYMLYGDASGKYTVVPWDFNMSFNGYSGGGGGRNAAGIGTAANTNATTASVDVPVLGISMESVPMINHLLQVPEYKTKYLGYVSEVVTYLEGIQGRVAELSDLIRPSVQADPTKFYTMEQFESNMTYSTEGDKNGGMQGGGMTPPEGMEDMTPPDGDSRPEGGPGGARPEGASGERPSPPEGGFAQGGGQGPGQGQGMGTMASGSLLTFALNRLANLQEQLGLPVTPLPEAASSDTPAASQTGAAQGISVVLDGQRVVFDDQQPVNQNGSILAPVKAIFEALGATVTWDDATRTVTAVKADTTIVLTIGSETAYVNNEPVILEAPASIIGGRTLVPVRFISEGLHMNVGWDQAASAVTISSAAAQ